jgi:hypothetical protein
MSTKSSTKSSSGKGKDRFAALTDSFGEEARDYFVTYFDNVEDTESFSFGIVAAAQKYNDTDLTDIADELTPDAAIEEAATDRDVRAFIDAVSAYVKEAAESGEATSVSSAKKSSSAKKPSAASSAKKPSIVRRREEDVEEADSKDEIIAKVDYLVRLLVILRGYEKTKDKRAFIELLRKFIKDYSPDSQVSDALFVLVNQGLKYEQSDALFSKGIITLAKRVLKFAQHFDEHNWFGTLDTQIFIHEPSLQALMEEAKEKTQKKKEREPVHFSVICTGTPPSKKTLMRYNFQKADIDKAIVIFYLFHYVKPIQAKKMGKAIVELEKDVASLRKLLEGYNDDYAVGWKERNIFGEQIEVYINKKSLESVKAFCDRYVHSGTSNTIRARGMPKVKNPKPLQFQAVVSRGPAPISTNPSVFLEPLRTWLQKEKLPATLFNDMATAAEKAVGANKYKQIKALVSEMFDLEEKKTLAQMGFAYVATMRNIMPIALYEGGIDTIRLNAKKGVYFVGTEAIKKLMSSKVEFGVNAEGQRTKGSPTSIIDLSDVAAERAQEKKLDNLKVGMASQIHRDASGRVRGINPDALVIKNLDKAIDLSIRPFKYVDRNGREVNDMDENSSIFLKKKITIDGVETNTSELSVGNVSRADLTSVLDAELAAAKAHKLEAAKLKDATKLALTEERTREQK